MSWDSEKNAPANATTMAASRMEIARRAAAGADGRPRPAARERRRLQLDAGPPRQDDGALPRTLVDGHASVAQGEVEARRARVEEREAVGDAGGAEVVERRPRARPGRGRARGARAARAGGGRRSCGGWSGGACSRDSSSVGGPASRAGNDSGAGRRVGRPGSSSGRLPPFAQAASRSAARSRALRARGLAAISASVGVERRPGDEAQPGRLPADADGRLRRADAAAPLGGEEALDDAVLERVVGQDDEAAARPQQVDGGGEALLERVELLVDRDPQRLEDARRRMDPAADARVGRARRARRARPAPRRSRSGPSRGRRRWPWRSSTRTAPRRTGGTARPARRRRASRAARRPARRASCRSACRAARRPGSRSRARGRRAGSDDSPRSNSAPSTAPKPASGATVGELPEVRLAQDQAIAEAGQADPDALDGGRVGVEAEDAAIGAGGLQDPLGVPTAAERGVDLKAAGRRGEGLDDLVRHHRQVPFLHLSSTVWLRIPSGPWKRMWCDVRSPGRRWRRRRRTGPRGPGCSRPTAPAPRSRRGRGCPGPPPRSRGPRTLAQVLRDEDPTLAVELRLEGPGEQLPLEQPRVGIGHGQARDLRRELLPGRHREDREAGVEPPRDHAATVELRAETRRDGDAPLLVDRVPVLAGEHRAPVTP